MRLQKALAHSGVASRRKAEEYIRDGRVRVNGQVVIKMGVLVTANDIIEVDGKAIKLESKKVYIILHKPKDYITSVSDPRGRKTVIDLISGIEERIYPVGRLDYDSSGLLFLTNDGEFAHYLMHPKHEILKTYIVTVKGEPSPKAIQSLKNGIRIENYVTAPAYVNVLSLYENKSKLEITIHEGRNRQVRKMCEKIGNPVIRLKRVTYGGVELGNLKPGEWRFLTESEIKQLMEKM